MANGNGLNQAIERNIAALAARRAEEDARAPSQVRIAGAITRFAGSMTFVYVHVIIVLLWVAINLGWVPGVPRFDPTFVILATVASVEAIFISTFVLISQNRMQALADRRSELDLHINLLTEHELTRLAALLAVIAGRLGIDPLPEEVREIEQDIAPEAVLDELEARNL